MITSTLCVGTQARLVSRGKFPGIISPTRVYAGMTGDHKGAACLERDVGILRPSRKRQWPDAGIARVTRGGLVYQHIMCR